MNKKVIWLIVSGLMVIALVLASCAPAVVEEKKAKVVTKEPEKKVEEVVEKPAVLEPQHGGKFTTTLPSEPPSPAISDCQYNSLFYLDYIQERPLIGDIETYGPTGTGEATFQTLGYLPEKYWKGNLLESWEISPEKLVWHVRPGVYWAADNVDFMENRELTAEDVALDLIRFMESAWNTRFRGIASAEGVHVVDKYTLEIEFESYTSMLFVYLGYEDRAVISPPEVEVAGADKWANQVGTGPWMFEEYVAGSYMSFKRNPNYWDTTTIDGVEYQLPFVDRVVVTIIPDMSTQIAALQTGKLDIFKKSLPAHWDMIDRVTPELEYSTYFGTVSSGNIWLRCDEPPFDDVNVRRAMTIGTDIREFMKLAMATETPIPWWPVHPGNPAHIPLEELPADIQILYEYNPELAKQMLTDADYPGGFPVTVLLNAEQPNYLDDASLLKDQWAKIGVKLEIDVRPGAEWKRMISCDPIPDYKGCFEDPCTLANPLTVFSMNWKTGGGNASPQYSNLEFDALITALGQETDPAEQIRITKEASLHLQYNATVVPLHFDPGRVYWWPWVKNYYGAFTLQDDNCCFATVPKYIWIDQDLKAEMGY